MSNRNDDPRRVDGGGFYRLTPEGPQPADPQPPDVWVCRRVADFPHGLAPTGGRTTTCSRCGAAIVYNPARLATVPRDTPQVCMQCAGIQPLPIEGSH